MVICFFLVALSGISFFFPTLQWLTETFGTPQMGRILHPFFGVLIFVALMFMFVRFVHHNIPDKQDIPWLKGIVEVLKGNEHKVADVGKYNAGQKMMFWTIMSMIFRAAGDRGDYLAPILCGVFSRCRSMRYSLLIPRGGGDHPDARHPHPYVCGVLVVGSIKGMVEGKVSRRWGEEDASRAGIAMSNAWKR